LLVVKTWQLFSGDCPSQSIDTSSLSIEVISQIFEAQAGEHVLDIKFSTPIGQAKSKILVIMINEQIVSKFHPLYEDFSFKSISMSINL
jgi:hypothetical protein